MAALPKYRIWWLNPAWALVLALVPFSLTAYFLTNEQYSLYWRGGRFFDEGDLGFIGACVATFLLGGVFSQFYTAGPVNEEWGKLSPKELHYLFRIFMVGAVWTIIAYLIWFSVAVKNGMTPAMLYNILKGESGAAYETRTLLVTIPGVTTATQFAMAVFIMGTVLYFNGWRKRVLGWMVIILALAMLRNLFNNERLAITELAAPTICLTAYYCRDRLALFLRGVPSLLWPVVGVAFVYLLFTGSEYGRSWVTFYRDEGVYNSVWEFSAFRIVGYYVTALNNGSLYYHIGGTNDLPEATFHWFWKFPVIGPWTHDLLDPHGKPPVGDLLANNANPEFTNISMPFDIALDWGQIGAPIFFFIAGMTIFYFYRRFLRGNVTGLLIYPFFYTGLLEVSRVNYWTTSRAFPSWVLIIIGVYGIAKLRSKEKRRQQNLMEAEALALVEAQAAAGKEKKAELAPTQAKSDA